MLVEHSGTGASASDHGVTEIQPVTFPDLPAFRRFDDQMAD
jgi:hypothetical protein